MFKRINCENCQCLYDELDKECPSCGTSNPFVEHKRFGGNALIVPFWMQIVLFSVGWLGFQILGITISVILLGTSLEGIKQEAVLTFTAYGLLTVALVAIQSTQFKKYIKQIKNWLAPILGIAGFVAIIIFNISYGVFLNMAGLAVEDNANESSVNSIITAYPLLSLLVVGILGPLCEEITYRVGFYGFFRRINKYLAYGLTILVFALIHFDFTCFTSGTFINELLNLPYYMAAAFAMCFAFEKTGFWGGFAVHATNNIFSVLITLISSQMMIKLL